MQNKSHERTVQATSTPQAHSASWERAAQATRVKPDLTSCPDQAASGCPNR